MKATAKRKTFSVANARWGLALLLAMLLNVVDAQGFTYVTNNGTITITRYNCSASVVTIPGTGWGPIFADRATTLWTLPYPVILDLPPSFGVRTNRFGFVISWAMKASVVVEGCNKVANPIWSALATNSLPEAGWFYFSDPDWTNHVTRFYRVRSP